MNQHINSLLGPLEAATRQGSWEDAEDIAREISRLARLERLSELQKIQNALHDASRGRWGRSAFLGDPQMAPRGSHGAKTPLSVSGLTPIKQGESTVVGLADEQWPFG